MPPVQGDESMSQMGVYLPNNVKEALFLLAHHRSEPRDETTGSGLAREYIAQGLANEDNLPEDVREILHDDLLAKAGEDEITEEVEG